MDGVRVPAGMAAQVARWIVAGVAQELREERERGGPPFPAAPYLALAHDLRTVARGGQNWPPNSTDPSGVRSDHLVTVAQWAARSGRSGRSVRRDCRAGRIPATLIGHQWMIDQTGVHSG